MEHSFFVCSATATTVYFDVSTDISTCCCFEHIIIFISYIFVGPPFGKTIHPPMIHQAPSKYLRVVLAIFRPSGWTDRVQTTNFCFCRLFGPDGASKGGGSASAIDFFRLKHYKDFCLRLPSGYTCTRKQTCVSVFGASMLKKKCSVSFFLQHATADWLVQANGRVGLNPVYAQNRLKRLGSNGFQRSTCW